MSLSKKKQSHRDMRECVVRYLGGGKKLSLTSSTTFQSTFNIYSVHGIQLETISIGHILKKSRGI